MTSIIITFFVIVSGIIWWIYHNEIVHEIDNIYNSVTWKKVNTLDNSGKTTWLAIKWERQIVFDNQNNDKLNLYHLLDVSNWLLNNWNKLLKDWFSLNSDLYKVIENINNLWKWLTDIEKNKLTNILLKYKRNIELQKEFLKSEFYKRDCIEKKYNWFNKNTFIGTKDIETVKKIYKKNIVSSKSTKLTTTKTSSTTKLSTTTKTSSTTKTNPTTKLSTTKTW